MAALGPWRCSLIAMTAAVLPVMPGLAQVPEGASLGTQEAHPTRVLPQASPHWVYVLEPVFPHLVASKVWILDGDTLEYKGMSSAGYVANLALGKDLSSYYIGETYWSRGARGDRTDVVTTYDAKTLEVIGEVILPKGRFLVVPKKYNFQLSDDGRYLYSFNMDPAFGLSLLDIKANKYVGEIETGGCSLAFPTGNNTVASLCPDGSFAHITIDASGQASIENSEPFFDSETDPVFEHPALSRTAKKAFFISYEGWVYPVGMDGAPKVGERWKLQGDGDAAWRPGGWEIAAYHTPTDRLFVQMHEGGQWTHKQAGTEIWVYEASTGKRLQRIKTEHPSFSLAVTTDDKPLLFSLTETAAVHVFDATSYEHKGAKEGVGITPFVLYTPGE
jgi:methylamine dehydrogenase heavy chain